jgi:hypothetical protein
VGRSTKLYKRAQKCQSLSKTCFIFVWKIVRTPLLVVDKDNHLSKSSFYLSVLQMKSSSTCLITASLYEGPFFYFYVESSPSIFMHCLREHSCHSEYNVHSPKVLLIDSWSWFHLFLNYLYLVALLNLKVSYAFMFCSPWRTSWKPFVCFSLWFEHTFDFHYFIVHDLLFVFYFIL